MFEALIVLLLLPENEARRELFARLRYSPIHQVVNPLLHPIAGLGR